MFKLNKIAIPMNFMYVRDKDFQHIFYIIL